MACVRPFAAWRYASPDGNLTDLAAPPYDVVSDVQRGELLLKDPHNAVALELPDGALDTAAPANRYATGKQTWDEWRDAGVLVRDASPSIYVLEQRFTLEGRPVHRRAFIAEVRLEPFGAGVVIPHERTLPKALGDRFELIKATGANLSQVFGMFDDEKQLTDALFSRAMSGEPVAHAIDADGVESTLWASDDPALAGDLTAFMTDRRIFIADGHHRYTTALAYRDLRRAHVAADEVPQADPNYDYTMMALVNMDDPDLAVLPYHRIANAGDAFDFERFYTELAVYFDISDVPCDRPTSALDGHDRTAFLVKTRGDERPRVAALRADVALARAMHVDHSDAWRSLDVAVLQELVLWPLLGIHPDHPETLERISFTKDADRALAATEDHDVAFVLRPTRLDQLREISLNGETMPQKSTYFYPKLLSGLVFRAAD